MSLAEKVDTGEVVLLSLPSLRHGPLVRATRIDADRVTDLVPLRRGFLIFENREAPAPTDPNKGD